MLALQNPHKLRGTIGDVFDTMQVLNIVLMIPETKRKEKKRKEKKRKEKKSRRQLNEKPSITSGCPAQTTGIGSVMTATGGSHCIHGKRVCLQSMATKLTKAYQQDGRNTSMPLICSASALPAGRVSTHTHTSSMTGSLPSNKARQVSLCKPLVTLCAASMHIWLASNPDGGDGGVLQGTAVVLRLLRARWCNLVLATAGTTNVVFPHRRQVTGNRHALCLKQFIISVQHA